MLERISGRRISVPVVVAIAFVGVVVSWVWAEGANERRVDELIEMTYDYTELGGEPPIKMAHSESKYLGEAFRKCEVGGGHHQL